MSPQWWKSGRSGSSGGQCVEVAVSGWWKSSRSGSEGANCVEVAVSGWRKSSQSGSSGGACVEVADGGERWHVRDSKDPDGGMLCVAAPSWHAFVAAVKTDTV